MFRKNCIILDNIKANDLAKSVGLVTEGNKNICLLFVFEY